MAKLKTVRIVKTEYGTYSLHFTNPDGRRRRLSVGPDFTHAQRLAVRFTDWLMAGKDPEREFDQLQQTEKAQRLTVREFFDVFMDRHGIQQSKGMQASYRNSFKNVCRCKDITDAPLSGLTKGLVLSYMHQRMKTDQVSPATCNREAAFLKCMCSRAFEWELIPHNPLVGLRLLKEAEKREVNLTLEQLEALINSFREPMSSIVEFAVYTGFRRENILNLKIEDIRFHDLSPTGEVSLVTKGNKQGVYPLGPNAVALLKRVMGKRKEGYVFLSVKSKNRFSCIHATFDRAVEKLGLKVGETKLRFHDLRHVYASLLHRQGVSLDVLRSLMGHASRETTDRYTTIDRLDHGKVLSLMPQLRRKQA
jgi:integrase